MADPKTVSHREGAKTVPSHLKPAPTLPHPPQYTMMSNMAFFSPRTVMQSMMGRGLQQRPLPRNATQPLQQSSPGLLRQLPHSPERSRMPPSPGFSQLAKSPEKLRSSNSHRFPPPSTVVSPQLQRVVQHQPSPPSITSTQSRTPTTVPYRQQIGQSIPADIIKMEDPYHSLLANQVQSLSAVVHAATAPPPPKKFEIFSDSSSVASPSSSVHDKLVQARQDLHVAPPTKTRHDVGGLPGTEKVRSKAPQSASVDTNDDLSELPGPAMFSPESTMAQAQEQSDSDDNETSRPLRVPRKSIGTNLTASVRPLSSQNSTSIQDIPLSSIETANIENYGRSRKVGNRKRKRSSTAANDLLGEDDQEYFPLPANARQATDLDSIHSDSSDDQPLKLRSRNWRNRSSLPRLTSETLSSTLPRYQVPETLRSTRIALGTTDWNMYIEMVENLFDGKFDEEKLDREERKLFMVPTGMRLKIRTQMKEMVRTRHLLGLAGS